MVRGEGGTKMANLSIIVFLDWISYNMKMEFTINLSDLIVAFSIALGAGWIIYKINQVINANILSEYRLNSIERRLHKIERGHAAFTSEIGALRVQSHINSSPKSITKFNVVYELYKNIFYSGRLDVEDLKNMKFALGLNGEIDETTFSSFARTILETQWKKGNLEAISGWIKEYRPDIEEVNYFD